MLVAAFQQPDVRSLPPKQRVQKAMSRAGTSITVTSVTDIVAFLAGSITDIPAIRDFCFYAAIGIAFDFFLQITFFVVLMVFSAQREEKERYDWLCCVTAKNPSKNCCSVRWPGPSAGHPCVCLCARMSQGACLHLAIPSP